MKCSWAIGTLVLGCAACGSTNARSGQTPLAIDNPTGSCVAPGDGSRPGYHAAGSGVWLLDCKNVLAREYWRVFAVSESSAYAMPRPDGAPELAKPCADASHPLRSLVDAYGLCEAASSSAAVERVNDMLPADALQITHYLHTELRFVAGPSDISPFPIPGDIIDACELHPQDNSPEFVAICERERDRLESGHDIGFSYEGPGAVELAQRLNELYGIASSAP